MDKQQSGKVAATSNTHSARYKNFADFEVEGDEVKIENELWVTSIAHGGKALDEEDAVSSLLSLAGWVNTVEGDADQEWTQNAWP